MDSPPLTDLPKELTVEEFWHRFGRVEHETLDFKRGVPGDLPDTIAAMAMTNGGVIVHGVDADLSIAGCPLSQNTLDRIKRSAMECGVEVQVRTVRVGRRELTITEVPEVHDRVVTTPNGRLLRRLGGDSQPLRGDAMVRFVRARSDRPAEEEPVSAVTLSDLDLDAINEARAGEDRAGVGGESEAARALEDLQVALPGGASGPSRILRAGVVLFAERPDRFVPGASVQLVRRAGIGPGPGPSTEREECTGPLTAILRCCLEFVERHTRRFEAVTGSRREALPEYPAAAVREAVLNALAHRDYGLSGATVDITIWDDRLEVQSPGPLPGHITSANIRDEHFSRNRRIMRVLKTMGLVEEYGEGVDRMFAEMEARLMEPPIITATSSSVTVTLRNRFLVSVEDQVWLSLLGRSRITMAERRILVAARREGSVTPRGLRKIMPGADVGGLLAGAVAKGLLVLVGERGGSRYELSDEIVLRAGGASIEAQSRKRQLLLDEIGRRGSIQTAEAAELLGETVAAARQILSDLRQSGRVGAAGRTRGRRWFRV